jgi:replicative DNA helicase
MALATGRLDSDEWERFSEAVYKVGGAALYFDDTTRMTVEHIVDFAVTRFRDIGRLGLVVIDGLNAIESDTQSPEIPGSIKKLWTLARSLNCPIWVTTTLPRTVESRADKRPSVSDLPDSDVIEQYAGGIVFLFRKEHYDRETSEPGIAEVVLARNPGRPTGTIKLAFLTAVGSMENLLV